MKVVDECVTVIGNVLVNVVKLSAAEERVVALDAEPLPPKLEGVEPEDEGNPPEAIVGEAVIDGGASDDEGSPCGTEEGKYVEPPLVVHQSFWFV